MRIGIDARSTQVVKEKYRGIGRYTINLINALARIDESNQYHLYINGLWPCGVRVPADNFCLDSGMAWSLFSRSRFLEWQVRAPADLRARRFDVFHFTFSQNVPLLKSGPIVVTVHDLISIIFREHYRHNKLRPLFDWMWTKATKKADRIIAVSESTKRDIIEYLDVSEDKIKVVYEAADPIYRPVTEDEAESVKRRFKTNGSYIMYVGGMDPRKNLEGLLDAYRRLPTDLSREHKLVVVGRLDQWYPEIEKLISEFGLRERVVFTGFVPDEMLVALYNGASVFVLPSLYEGFGLPLLEAMSCRTPVVCSNAASIPEVIGDAALMVDPHDVDGLAAAIERALTDSELREGLREKGFKRAKSFSWEKTARETLAVYEEIAEK